MPPTIRLTPALRGEYEELFRTCRVRDSRAQEVEGVLARFAAGRPRYEAVGGALGIPWHVVALLHCMEGSLRFDTHLHNGDPLTARTRQVPAGRPPAGQPPFTWEESATDALRFERFHLWQDWTLPGTLFKLEGYNGWGYRRFHPQCRTPYLWSFSNLYEAGKYAADGRWSDTLVSKQCGAAVLLRRMAEKGVVPLGEAAPPAAPVEPPVAAPAGPVPAAPAPADGPLLRFAPEVRTTEAETLQAFLNRIPGVFVKVDGKAGDKTSEAVLKVFGHFLAGDPRA